MIAETDGGMIDVVLEKPDGKYIEIPKDCYPPKFMNETAIKMLKETDYRNDYVFWDIHGIVKKEHLSV
jgi:hypothetical protein